jgi:hypothetical protein
MQMKPRPVIVEKMDWLRAFKPLFLHYQYITLWAIESDKEEREQPSTELPGNKLDW